MSYGDDMTASNGLEPDAEDDEFGSEDYDDDELDPEEDVDVDEE